MILLPVTRNRSHHFEAFFINRGAFMIIYLMHKDDHLKSFTAYKKVFNKERKQME